MPPAECLAPGKGLFDTGCSFPSALHQTLGQIHSALAYYWDYKVELDRTIEERLAKVDQLKGPLKPCLLADRLKANGLR